MRSSMGEDKCNVLMLLYEQNDIELDIGNNQQFFKKAP